MVAADDSSARLEDGRGSAAWWPKHIKYTEAADVWSAGLVANDMITGSFVFGFPPSEFELWKAIIALLGEPTESSWPGVSQLPYYQKLSAGRDHSPARGTLCSAALTWLRPDAVDESTPGSLRVLIQEDVAACLRGCVTMRPDLRLTAAAARSFLERACCVVDAALAIEATGKQSAFPPAEQPPAPAPSASTLGPPQIVVAASASQLPLPEPPLQSVSCVRCACAGDDCAQHNLERCRVWCRAAWRTVPAATAAGSLAAAAASQTRPWRAAAQAEASRKSSSQLAVPQTRKGCLQPAINRQA